MNNTRETQEDKCSNKKIPSSIGRNHNIKMSHKREARALFIFTSAIRGEDEFKVGFASGPKPMHQSRAKAAALKLVPFSPPRIDNSEQVSVY